MKRLVIGLTITVIVLVSCATAPTVARNIDVQIKSETNSGMAEIGVIPTWREKSLFSAEGYSSFHGSFKNMTDKIVRIVWEKSYISYNGTSSTIFLEGQKYINASEPMSPTVIPAKGSVEKDMFSASQPYFVSGKFGGWRMTNIPAQDVIIVLCIESGGQEDYYTISVSQ